MNYNAPSDGEALLLAVTPENLVTVFVALREERQRYKEKAQLIRVQMDVIERVLLTKMKQLGQQNFKTENGYLAYQKELRTWSVADRDEFLAFLDENGMDYLQAGIDKAMAEQWVEAHDGAVPPGSKVNTILRVNVSRT